MTPKVKKLLLVVPVGLLAIALFLFLGGQIVKLLWNWLMPPLFGWSEVTFWQALGLLALCRILFGGRGFSRSDSSRRTPEERERFRQAFRKRFGLGQPPSELGNEAVRQCLIAQLPN